MPPPKKFTPDPQGRAATRLFVDRIGPRRLFTEALAALSGESQSFLVFYGMGGQGKSALRDECARIVAAERRSGRDIRCGVIDLKDRKQRIPCYTSVWARNALVEQGIRTPAFDLAFGVYWMAAFAEQPMPKMPHSSVWREGAVQT